MFTERLRYPDSLNIGNSLRSVVACRVTGCNTAAASWLDFGAELFRPFGEGCLRWRIGRRRRCVVCRVPISGPAGSAVSYTSADGGTDDLYRR